MQKLWTLTTKTGETVEGLSNDEAALAIHALMAGDNVPADRSEDTREHEIALAA